MSPRVLTALITVQILFGMNYVISKIVVAAWPPLFWASFRILISTLFLLSYAFFSGRKSPRGLSFFGPLVIFSLLGIIINQSSFLMGLRLTTSTNSAILNTLIPVFTLAIVTMRGIEKMTPKRLLGFFLAFSGVLIIRKIENFTFSDQTFVGDLLNIVNCISYSLFLSYSKKFLEKYDPVWSVTWLFAYGSIGLTLIALPDWLSLSIPTLTPRLLACMAFAIFGGTLTTYFLNTWALVYARSSSVALFIYLQPIVASLLAWIWLGEPITLRAIASSALIFLGFFFALSLENEKAKT